MSLVTVADVRDHTGIDISDDAVQQLIDDAEAEIISAVGAVATHIDEIQNSEPYPAMLFLSRKASSISTIIEQVGDTETTLAATDYRIRHTGFAIERLSTGTNPACVWGWYVKVTYVPIDDTAKRKRVVIDLVKLAAAYSGVKSESIGPYSDTEHEYQTERSKLISALVTTWMA